jgi:hypothetical protein
MAVVKIRSSGCAQQQRGWIMWLPGARVPRGGGVVSVLTGTAPTPSVTGTACGPHRWRWLPRPPTPDTRKSAAVASPQAVGYQAVAGAWWQFPRGDAFAGGQGVPEAVPARLRPTEAKALPGGAA